MMPIFRRWGRGVFLGIDLRALLSLLSSYLGSTIKGASKQVGQILLPRSLHRVVQSAAAAARGNAG
jgi:hypothetical protein